MSTPTPDGLRAELAQKVQPHVPEPILALGFLSVAGSMAGFRNDMTVGSMLSSVSPLLGFMHRRKKHADYANTVHNQLTAVTASSVYLFDYPTTRDAFVVRSAPSVWSRAQILVSAGAPTKHSQSLHVDFVSGERVDVDINFSAGAFRTFSDAMRDLLLQPVAV